MGSQWGNQPGDRPLSMRWRVALGAIVAAMLIGLSCQGPEPATQPPGSLAPAATG